jgi:hypothetical protein
MFANTLGDDLWNFLKNRVSPSRSRGVSFSGSDHWLAPVINVVYNLVPFTRPFQYALMSPQNDGIEHTTPQ